MKSFKSYLKEYGGYGVDTPAFAVGGASTGPGMGQYVPSADLNLRASKQKIKYLIYQRGRGVGKTARIVMKNISDINTARKWIKDNGHSFDHKGKNFQIYKYTGSPNNIKPDDLVENSNPRIPRKKGQPAGSDKHSDLYTDENPKGTIHGLKFATVKDAEESVRKIKNSGKKHAHKVQAAIAMEQRAREMGKISAADVYREYINKMKKKTKEMQKEDFLITENFGIGDVANKSKLSELIFRGSTTTKDRNEVDNMYIPMSGATTTDSTSLSSGSYHLMHF